MLTKNFVHSVGRG